MRDNQMVRRLVLAALLFYALGSFTAAQWELRQQQTETRDLEEKKQMLLAQSRELEARLTAVEYAGPLRRLAWEKLRMVSPGERIFLFTKPEGTSD